MERMTPNIEKLFQQKMNNAESHSFSPELKTSLLEKVKEMQQMTYPKQNEAQLQSDVSESVAKSPKQGWNARLFEGAAGVKTVLIAGTLMLGVAAVFIVNAMADDAAEKNITESVVAPVLLEENTVDENESSIPPAEIGEPVSEKNVAAVLDEEVAAQSSEPKVADSDKAEAHGLAESPSEKVTSLPTPVKIENEDGLKTAVVEEQLADASASVEADDFNDADASSRIAKELTQDAKLDDEVVSGQEQKADSAPVYIRKTHVEENITVRLKKQKGRHAKRRNRK